MGGAIKTAVNLNVPAKMSTCPVARVTAGNSPIRGRRWYEFYPHGGLNGAEVIPVGDHGGGDGMQAPVPAPRGDPILKAHILAMPNTCDI